MIHDTCTRVPNNSIGFITSRALRTHDAMFYAAGGRAYIPGSLDSPPGPGLAAWRERRPLEAPPVLRRGSPKP